MKRPHKVVMYEFIEYSKERIRVFYFIAVNLFDKPISEFTDFAAAIAIVLLFCAFFNIIAAESDIFDESIEFLFIIFLPFFPYIIFIGIFF